jgi:exopolyphosphatase/guanosine-5'-triphosphate,3'-diphosphate pyrophosphatase
MVDTKLSTRLSAGVGADGSISDAAIQRQLAALDQFQTILLDHDVSQPVVCATQVFRIAPNGAELAERIEARYGWRVDVIEGRKEAELSYRAATSGLEEVPDNRVVVDIGGGSTEVVYGVGDCIEFSRSFPVGAVNLSEACQLTGEADDAALSRGMLHIGAIVTPDTLALLPRNLPIYWVGGTAATLATLFAEQQVFDPAVIHGVRLAREWVTQTAVELARQTVEQRRRRLVFDPDRAEIIVAGGLIISYLMGLLGGERLTVSNRGVRWGLLFERFPYLNVSGIEHRHG